MTKIHKRVLSALLALIMLIAPTVFGISAMAANTDTYRVTSVEDAAAVLAADGLEPDDVYPTIIIHGIGQALTHQVDANGDPVYDADGKMITGWPLYFNTNELIKKLALPLVLTLLFQHDVGLSESAYSAVCDAMELIAYNEDGTPKNNYAVEGFGNRSLAECNAEEKKFIYDRVALKAYTDKVGEENLYYFAYNSFGDTYSIVDDLEAIIEKAKADTGKDKVNLVPISLGGAISVAYFGEHPQGEDLNKVVFIVPALDGSEIVGKVMADELDYTDRGLYDSMFTKLMGENDYTGWMVNVLIRLLPKQVYKDFLSAVARGLSDAALSKITNMWALVPGSMYDELAAKYLTPGTPFTAKVEKFRAAQMSVVDTLKNYASKGIGVYDINGYGLELYSLVASDSSTDKIIHSSSTSIGATFGKVGEPLGKDYVQQKYTEHNFISPDGEVDASTCAFPFTTWFFVDQSHDSIGNNDVVVRLASEILTTKNMTVFSDPNYPQFNYPRDSKSLYTLIDRVKAMDTSELDPQAAQQLADAVADAEAVLKSTVVVPGEMEAAETALEDALIAAGLREPRESQTLDQLLLFVFKATSKTLYYFFGPRGFTDPIWELLSKAANNA